MKEDDFIELDFGEEELESEEQSSADRENPSGEQGSFFVSYPQKKAGQEEKDRRVEVKPEEETEPQSVNSDAQPAGQTIDSVPEIKSLEGKPRETPKEQTEQAESEQEALEADEELLLTELPDEMQETVTEFFQEESDSEENKTEEIPLSEESPAEAAPTETDRDFPEEARELSNSEQLDGFYDTVREIPLPGAEDLPDFGSGSVYGASPEMSSGEGGLTAIPKEREKILWYLSLPFITFVLLIPVVGIIAGAVLLYYRYRTYRHEQQINDLTTAYIILAICLTIGFLVIYCIAQLFERGGSDGKETVPGQADREAAESLAREEAEEREREELEAWLRTSAQADIGLEEIAITVSESVQESGEELTGTTGTLEAELSGENEGSEEAGTQEDGGLWEAFFNKLTGNTGEDDQEYLDNVAADLQELAVSGDSCAQYSLMRLSGEVSLFTASYDDRFLGERQALFAFMSSYQGMQIDNQTFHLKSSLVDMFSGTVHWDATLDNTQYRYLGTVEDGMPQGMGVVLVASNANPDTYIPLYAGTFVNGTMEGYGMAFKENSGFYGIVYEGYFSGGKYAGRGTTYEIPSSVNFQNRLSMQDMAGNQYTAEEISGILNAYSTRYTNAMYAYQSEGALYAYLDVPVLIPVITERGRYTKGNANGYCIRYGSFGIRQYAGILKNGVRSGLGTSYYENGSIEYDGEWRNGRYHGRGTLYNADGSIWYEGEFANGDIKPVTQ